MGDGAVRITYEKLWPEAERIRTAAYHCGGPRVPRCAADYLGFDLLNGGLREVWALRDALSLSTESRALDLGCGIGGPARFIAERSGCRIVGLDLISRQTTTARALTRGLDVARQIRFVNGNARHLPFADCAFTHVYSNEAFIHVQGKERAIAEAFRVLRRGGLFCVQDAVGARFDITLLEESLHPFTVDQYRDALARSGFCDISAIDRTTASRQAYAHLAQLVMRGPISPFRVLTLFDRLHGIHPPLHRFLAPERIVHVARYMANRYQAALTLLGTPWRVEGMRRMCEEIVAAFDRGALRFYLIRARKPDG